MKEEMRNNEDEIEEENRELLDGCGEIKREIDDLKKQTEQQR